MKFRMRDAFVLNGLFLAGDLVGRFWGLSAGLLAWALTTVASAFLSFFAWQALNAWREPEKDHPPREITRTVRVIFETKGAEAGAASGTASADTKESK